MRTDDLIRVLAASNGRTRPLRGDLLGVAAGAAVLTLALFLLVTGARPDLAAALHDWRVVFKFAFSGLVATLACIGCIEASRPEGRVRLLRLLWPAIALLVAGAGLEALTTPPARWAAAAHGATPGHCVRTILATAILPALAMLAAMRRGASSSPSAAGAVAGLLAGGVGATVFALACPNDSAFFVAVWYVLAMAGMSALGALAGSRLLAW